VPGGITRAEQEEFIERYKEDHEENDFEIWRVFIVGIPSD
jgi:hypothetical protein